MTETDHLSLSHSAARRLEPLAASLRDRLDRERRLQQELVQAIGDAGLFSMWLPRALGRPELAPIAFLKVIEELSRQDASVGWCTAIAAGHDRFAGPLPRRTACEIFGSGRTILAGTLNPVGTAVAIPGGYRVTGRWRYGSVIDHSQWVYGCGNCVTHDGADPRLTQDGTPPPRSTPWCQNTAIWSPSVACCPGSHQEPRGSEEWPLLLSGGPATSADPAAAHHYWIKPRSRRKPVRARPKFLPHMI